MFSRKKLLLFGGYSVVLALAFFWLHGTIIDAFTSAMESKQREIVSAVADAAPTNPDRIPEWLTRVRDEYDNLTLIYLRGDPALDEVEVFAPDEELLAFHRELSEVPEYETGIESAIYQEKYFSVSTYRYRGDDVRIVFVPVVHENGFDLEGTAIFMVPTASAGAFGQLVRTLIIGLFLAAVVAYAIARFSRDPFTGFVILALFLIVGIFVAYPLLEAVRLSFVQGGSFSLQTWRSIFSTGQYLSALRGSIQLGVLTATASTLIGFLFSFAVTRTRMLFKKTISVIATLPVISPPFSLTLSIILLFGNNGLITRRILGLEEFSIYGLGGLVLVQTIGMFPIAFLTLTGVLQGIDSTLEEASMDLRAGKLETFRRITLPLAMPGIMSSWLLVFTTSLADFANPLLLAGSYRVLSVEAYIAVTGLNLLGTGAALSILLLLPTMAAFLAQRYWVGRKSFVTVTGKPSARLSDLVAPPVRIALSVIIGLLILFILGLYGTIVAGCFVENWGIDYSFTLRNITEALERGMDAIRDTVTLAAVATPIAGILAMIAAVIVVRKRFAGKRLLEGLILAPFAVPGTLIGISYILAFNKPPILLVGTGAIIIISYVIRELPVGLEGGVATLRQIDPSIEEAAADLGADQQTVFRDIILPLIRPAFISSMSYTFVRSMTAVSAIIFLISARWYHMTVLIYNFSENLRFGYASVLATVLIIIVLAAFGLMRLVVRQSAHLEKSVTL